MDIWDEVELFEYQTRRKPISTSDDEVSRSTYNVSKFFNARLRVVVNQKSGDFGQMFVISKKKTISQGMDLKIYRKSKA